VASRATRSSLASVLCLWIAGSTPVYPQNSIAPSADPALNERRAATEAALESVALIERKAMVSMRDGVRLSTDIYRPKSGVHYREGYDREVWMKPDVTYPVHLGPMVTSNYFAPGHRIRLEVSSSSFPAFDRNLNTGGHNYDETQGLVARNVVHHSRIEPSSMTLTVVEK
jgi:predicted acyl esterase